MHMARGGVDMFLTMDNWTCGITFFHKNCLVIYKLTHNKDMVFCTLCNNTLTHSAVLNYAKEGNC